MMVTQEPSPKSKLQSKKLRLLAALLIVFVVGYTISVTIKWSQWTTPYPGMEVGSQILSSSTSPHPASTLADQVWILIQRDEGITHDSYSTVTAWFEQAGWTLLPAGTDVMVANLTVDAPGSIRVSRHAVIQLSHQHTEIRITTGIVIHSAIPIFPIHNRRTVVK